MQVSIYQRQRDGVGHDGQVLALKLCLLLKPMLAAPVVGEVSRARLLIESESLLHAIVHFDQEPKRMSGDRLVDVVIFVRVDALCRSLERNLELPLIGCEVEVRVREATEDPEEHVVARNGRHGRSRTKRGRVVARV